MSIKNLTIEQVSTLAEVFLLNAKDRDLNKRALQTKDPSQSFLNFSPIDKVKKYERLHNAVTLSDENKEIFEKSFSTKVNPKVLSQSLNLEKIIAGLSTSEIVSKIKNDSDKERIDSELKVVANVATPKEVIEGYSPYFALFNTYGCTIHNMLYRTYKNNLGAIEKKLVVIFIVSNQYIFELEFPRLDRDYAFTTSKGNKYFFMPKAKNLIDYAEGRDEYLELIHPYVWLSSKALEYKFDGEVSEPIKQEYFDGAIKRKYPNTKKMQNRMYEAMRSAKSDDETKREITPIVWFNSKQSNLSLEMAKENIFLGCSQEFIHKYKSLKGVDLFTGSTSEPGKRCKLASNYGFSKIGKALVIKKVRFNSDEFDYLSETKRNVGLMKTSAKRNNSATVSKTYPLTKPSKYVSRINLV